MSNRIDLKCHNIRRKEGKAAGAFLPGCLVRVNSDNEITTQVADVYHARHFALANITDGKGIDDAYAADDTVEYMVAVPGDEVLGWLTTSQTIAIGAVLAPAANGHLEAVTGDHVQATAIALEAVTTTGAAARIRVEVL